MWAWCAIGNHDEGNGQPVSAIAAALILADKSDVRRSRVQEPDEHKFDIHDRVNYSVTDSKLKINKEQSAIKLKLSIDTHYGEIGEYFEIFMERMLLCKCEATLCHPHRRRFEISQNSDGSDALVATRLSDACSGDALSLPCLMPGNSSRYETRS